MHRFLPIVFIFVVALTLYLYLPARRFIAIKLNLAAGPNPSCCTMEDVLHADGQFEESANLAIFNNEIVDYPKTSLAQNYMAFNPPSSNVLGTHNSVGEEKWIEVSLAEQKLRAWEGARVVMEFLISSGSTGPTPRGDFAIWYKTRSQRMRGGSRELGTYYNLPNVPNNMFFYLGYAIHGAYWHNNFGHPMSHGCVNAPLAQVAQLFEWTGPGLVPGQNIARASGENPGTRVYVH